MADFRSEKVGPLSVPDGRVECAYGMALLCLSRHPEAVKQEYYRSIIVRVLRSELPRATPEEIRELGNEYLAALGYRHRISREEASS